MTSGSDNIQYQSQQQARLTLRQVLDHADSHSPLLLEIRASRGRAQAERREAASILPFAGEVSALAGKQGGGQNNGSRPYEITLLQPLPIPGERGLAISAARDFAATIDAEVQAAEWSVHQRIHMQFHSILAEQERNEIAEETVEFQQDVLRIARVRLAAGEISQLMLDLAETELHEVQAELVSAQGSLKSAVLQLATFAGLEIDPLPVLTGSSSVTVNLPRQADLIEKAIVNQPALRVATARVREAEARASLATRRRIPRPSLGVEYRQEGEAAVVGKGSWFGVVSVPLNLFTYGRNDANVARAETVIASAALRQEEAMIAGDISAAYARAKAAEEKMAIHERNILPRLEQNLVRLRRAFELGEIDLLELSSGRERLLRIRGEAVSARLEYLHALAELEGISGVDLLPDTEDQQDGGL